MTYAIRILHPAVGTTAFIIIALFWSATVVSELSGNPQLIASVKQAIIWGMLLLIPCLIATAVSGFRLGRHSAKPRVASKRRRMPLIGLNGLLILLPCAVFLAQRAGVQQFDGWFYAVQSVELVAGGVNLMLIGASIRDGILLARQRRLSAQRRHGFGQPLA